MKYPFFLIHNEDGINYYIFHAENTQFDFLAVEGKLTLKEHNSRRLFRKTRDTTITTNFRMFPINSAVLYLIMQAQGLATCEKEIGGEMHTIYSVWSAEDTLDISTGYKTLVDKQKTETWSFKPAANPVVKGFIKDGYAYLGKQEVSSLERQYLLYKPTVLGNLIFMLVREAGTVTSPLTGGVETMIATRDLMDILLHIYIKNEESENND